MRIARVVALVLVASCGGSQAGKKTVTKVTKPDTTTTDTKPPPPPPPKALTTDERVAFHDGCFADFLAEKPEFFTRCYSADSSEEMVDSGDPPAVGTPAIAASTRPFWDGFTLQGQVRMNLANGEKALTIALVRGTQDGKWQGLPASGKTFGLFVAEAQNLDDQGRHGTVRNYIDLAGMMAQLGAAPKGTKFRAPYPLSDKPPVVAIGTGSDAETANVAVIQAGFDQFNKKDWKGLLSAYYSDAAISEQAAPADLQGSKAIGKYFAEIGKGFPDAQEKIEDIWGAGDFVVAETVFTGTNNGPLPSFGVKKATSKAVTLRTAHVFLLEKDKIVQQWIFGNGMTIPLQLGLIAPPAAPPAP